MSCGSRGGNRILDDGCCVLQVSLAFSQRDDGEWVIYAQLDARIQQHLLWRFPGPTRSNGLVRARAYDPIQYTLTIGCLDQGTGQPSQIAQADNMGQG